MEEEEFNKMMLLRHAMQSKHETERLECQIKLLEQVTEVVLDRAFQEAGTFSTYVEGLLQSPKTQ